MRGKSIDKKWYDNDMIGGNKLLIKIYSNLQGCQSEYENIYYMIQSIKQGYLEYMYISYEEDKEYVIVAKFKDRIMPEHKAKLRKLLYEWNKSEHNSVTSIKTELKLEVEKLTKIKLYKGPAFTIELKLSINVKHENMINRNVLKLDFIDFMKRENLMLLDKTETFVDSI